VRGILQNCDAFELDITTKNDCEMGLLTVPANSVAYGNASGDKRGIMQRLSSWFGDHLPLRRRAEGRRAEVSRCSARKKAAPKTSKSAAPRLRYSNSTATTTLHESQQRNGCDRRHHYFEAPQNYMEGYGTLMTSSAFSPKPSASADFPLAQCDILSQSFTAGGSYRQKIRTNPWCRSQQRSSSIHRHNKTFFPNAQPTLQSKPNLEMLYASVDRGASIRVKSLDESTCSSGYGSQDHTPESSVHIPNWQPSTQIEHRGRLVDKAVECRSLDVDEEMGQLTMSDRSYDCSVNHPVKNSYTTESDHVYHELESLHRISKIFDDATSYECAFDMKYLHDTSRASSPIYAVPYEGSSASSASNVSTTSSFYPCHNLHESTSSEYSHVKQLPRNNYTKPSSCYASESADRGVHRSLEITSPFYASSLCRASAKLRTQCQSDWRNQMALPMVPAKFYAPPPPPVDEQTFLAFCNQTPQTNFDFLAELDYQIAELQVRDYWLKLVKYHI
jgi:hypothetical protein